MRYRYTKDGLIHVGQFGIHYICDHPVYSACTLYKVRDLGLAVIQQRYNPDLKYTTWGPIDIDLTDAIYLHPKFLPFFKKYAKLKDEKGLYPTVTIRQIMWGLRMKPLKRESWETYFDRKGF